MFTSSGDAPSMGIFLAYGFLILVYLAILRLLLSLMQQMGDKHISQRSVIDRAIHQTMPNDVETSMHAFDAYHIAIVIAKGGITAIAMAVIIIVSVMKFGIPSTILLVTIAISILWAFNRWLKNREKPGSLRVEIRKGLDKAGNGGAIVLLGIVLVILLFFMLLIY